MKPSPRRPKAKPKPAPEGKARIRISEHVVMRAGDLLPNVDNWRIHPPAQVDALRAVFAEVGVVSEVLGVRTRRGVMLLDGHLRADLDADQELPVAILDLTPAEQRKVLGTYDVIGAMAERDDPKFAAILRDAEARTEEFRQVLVAFTARLSDEPPSGRRRRKVDPNDVPDTPTVARAKSGELWLLGDHRLLCGDTTQADDVAHLMGAETADMVWTDPPYAIYGSSTGIGSDIADDKMVRPFFMEILRVSRDAIKVMGHVYVACDWRSWPSWWEMAKRVEGLTPKNLIVWDKGGSGLGSSYANTYELVGFFSRLPKQTVMTSGFKTGQRQVHASNVVRFDKVPGGQRDHNAQKPVGLVAGQIELSSDPGEIVVDWFAGSGTTIVAAEQTGRRCFAMEIEPKYVDVCVKRWEAFTGRKATRAQEEEG
jgi:DNA modification methylase